MPFSFSVCKAIVHEMHSLFNITSFTFDVVSGIEEVESSIHCSRLPLMSKYVYQSKETNSTLKQALQ